MASQSVLPVSPAKQQTSLIQASPHTLQELFSQTSAALPVQVILVAQVVVSKSK
jgi:hypothetical protein